MPAPRPPAAARHAPLPPRERLLLEAMRLFGERGVDAVPTREICTAAGVNRGAIHDHFGDKDGLDAEVLRQPVRELQEQLAGLDAPGLVLQEAICRFLRPFLFEDDGCHAMLTDDPLLEKPCVRLADWGCALVAFERERHASPP